MEKSVKDLLSQAVEELEQEKRNMAKEDVKERLKEIHMAKRTLDKLEKSFQKLLDKDIDDVDF